MNFESPIPAQAAQAQNRTGPPKVVICGGGAGGIELAIGLARRNGLHVRLVDPSPAHIWKPLLHEVAAGSLDVSTHEVSYLALARWRDFVFSQGALQAIDRPRKQIVVGPVFDEDGVQIMPERRFDYDLLVLCIGGVTNDFGTDGVREHALMLDTLSDAQRIYRRILSACTSASFAAEGSKNHFDVSIVGGGATGVELAAELRSTSRALRAYGLSGIDPDSFVRLTLLNADPRLLLQLPEHVAESVHQTLNELKVAIRNDAQVVGVEPASVTLKSGERVHSDLTIWTAGVKAPSLLRNIAGLETNRLDQIVVTPGLRSKTDADILAIGDCAAAPWEGHKTPVPPRAQAAHQQARYLVKSIPRILRGKDVRPFQYNDLGSLLSLGGDSAVGNLMGFVRGAGIEIEGALASLLYRWLYERHRAALFGWWTVIMNRLGRWLASRTQPRVKLH